MPSTTQPAPSLIGVELTQDQALHIAALLASALANNSNLPAMFRMEQEMLYDVFMGKLTEEQRLRVETAMYAEMEGA